jgi:hypothetical protein
MPVIIVDEGGKAAGAFIAGSVETTIGPLADERLYKALGFAVGLR